MKKNQNLLKKHAILPYDFDFVSKSITKSVPDVCINFKIFECLFKPK